MSWSVSCTGTPSEVCAELDRNAALQTGQCKVEIEAAVPSLKLLVKENFNAGDEAEPEIQLTAHGSGTVKNGLQVKRSCYVSIKVIGVLLALAVSAVAMPGTASAQYCRTGYATVVRSTYSPLAEPRVIVREAPVVLKEDFLTQQFLNSQLLASAGFNGGHFGVGGVGATQFQTGGLGAFQNAAGFAQGTLGSGASFQGAGVGQFAQQGQVAGGQPGLAGQQEQLRQLQLQRQQLVQQQAQQMAAQTPQQTADTANGGTGGAAGADPSGIDTLRAEATAAAVEILRKEIADLKAALSQPGAVVTPQAAPAQQVQPQQQYQQAPAPARQLNGNGNGVKPQASPPMVPTPQPMQPQQTIPPAREEARRVARK